MVISQEKPTFIGMKATMNFDQDNKDFHFVVTGFGPFNGVPDNPTSVLVTELLDYLHQRADDGNSNLIAALANTTETLAIETSAEAVREQIQNLQKKLEPYKSAIVLHLGVDYKAIRFHLEQCAYNDASFRVPDERGYQPSSVPILDTLQHGTTFTTSLDVPALVKYLNSTVATTLEDPPLANLSTDPGRFVCNYIYCTSMDAFACAKTVDGQGSLAAQVESSPRVQSLFLHVPPFEAVPKETQLDFVVQLMQALYNDKNGSKNTQTN